VLAPAYLATLYDSKSLVKRAVRTPPKIKWIVPWPVSNLHCKRTAIKLSYKLRIISIPTLHSKAA
jgi:hypothetical protein